MHSEPAYEHMECPYMHSDRAYEDMEDGYMRTDRAYGDMERGYMRTDRAYEDTECGYMHSDRADEDLECSSMNLDRAYEDMECGYMNVDPAYEDMECRYMRTDRAYEDTECGYMNVDTRTWRRASRRRSPYTEGDGPRCSGAVEVDATDEACMSCCPWTVTRSSIPDASAFDGSNSFGNLPREVCRAPGVCEDAASAVWSCDLLEGGPPLTLWCQPDCTGRRPDGLVLGGEADRQGTLGAYFARMAELEAASVPAFRRLARELARHGAPSRLVRDANQAARDEVRHARVARRLAHRFGGRTRPYRMGRERPRSFEALAVENAVEGCVRETCGALLATWQAHHARDPEVARDMDRIARDETKHASLAWKIDAWARRRLDAEARARVEHARTVALDEMRAALAVSTPSRELAAVAGAPTAAIASTLVAALGRQLAR